MPEPGAWSLRLRTFEAGAALCLARFRIAAMPFAGWRDRLGLDGAASDADVEKALRLACHVARAGPRLPFATKCLPRAAALSALLRRRSIAHRVVLAVRPHGIRQDGDDLHAWVTVGSTTVIGELPGPWLEALVLPRAGTPDLAFSGKSMDSWTKS